MNFPNKSRETGVIFSVNAAVCLALSGFFAYRNIHLHWLIPSLACLLGLQWGLLASLPPGTNRAPGPGMPGARSLVLSLLAVVNLLGVAAYGSILYCPEGCAFWTGCAALFSGLIYWAQARSRWASAWDPLRSRLAAMAGVLWGFYLLLFRQGLTYWLLDIIFAILALCLWLGRDRAVLFISAAGIFAVIGIRHTGNEYAVVLLNLLMLAGIFFGGGHWLQKRLERRAAEAAAAPVRKRSLLRIAIAAALFILLAVYFVRPVLLMVNPENRHKLLEAVVPAFPIQPPATLSPLASRLREHVVELAGRIGERSAYQPDEQDLARNYIVARLREAGYAPEILKYSAWRKSASGRTRPYYNIEARLPAKDGSAKEVWILGAHYDTAPGTPGADDNTSAVAVMLEAARLLRGQNASREIRFVAFGTEEPPAFTTQDMGSFRYAQYLKSGGVKIYGLLNLEMLGYYNSKPSSQLFPPFLDLFYPDRGDFVALTSNLSSYGLMKSVSRSWRQNSAFPLETVFLPSVLSALFISDHLNFWFAGERALMLSDTAYFRNPFYHQAGDTPDKLDYEKMAEVTRAVTFVLKAE
jgi:hypothetical protein